MEDFRILTDAFLPNGRPGPNCYTDPSIFAFEMSTMLDAGWQYAGPSERLSVRGNYLTTQLGAAQVMLVRTETDNLIGFSSTCLHRGAPIAKGCGNAQGFQCPYHGWCYSLEGQLIGRPSGIDLSNPWLPRIGARALGPLLFARGDKHKTESRDAPLTALNAVLAPTDLRGASLVATRTYEVTANWKIVAENFLECYHCPLVHRKTLTQIVDLREYEVEVSDGLYKQGLAPRRTARRQKASVLDDYRTVYFIFPNSAVSIGAGAVVTFRLYPTSVTSTNVIRDFFGVGITDESLDYYDSLMREDIQIVEEVQAHANSPLFQPGPYVPQHELAIEAFHRDYVSWLLRSAGFGRTNGSE